MKTIILKSITMINWRGENNRTTTFNEKETTIAGDNGIGKTRHREAFLWLLFGKDSQGRKDFEIKTRKENGEVIHKIGSTVYGVLLIDGNELLLKRTFIEEWAKERGTDEEFFKGNKTVTYWNDVLVTVTEYQRRINEIVDENVLKIITNPLYFPSMKWKEQREVLLKLSGTVTDNEIAAKDPKFTELIKKMDGKSFDDFKKGLAFQKKKLSDQKDKIQPKIEQTVYLMGKLEGFCAGILEEETKALESTARYLAQQIATIERDEDTLKAFTKAKITEAEARINRLFSKVQFQQFDYTIEGNESETCIPFVDGVNFQSANTASQINAGLEIINVISRFYNVTAPIFIDRRESVNEITETNAQIINLKVTKSKILKIY
jgi:predicted ATP-dependent endonuclease of OLD family